MRIDELKDIIVRHPKVEALVDELGKNRTQHLLLSGLHASERAVVMLSATQRLCAQKKPTHLLIILDTQDEAQYLYADLLALMGEDTLVTPLYFPSAKRRRQGVDESLMIQRTETLAALSPEHKNGARIVVSYPEALAEPVPAPEALASRSLTLNTGDTIQLSALNTRLSDLGFQRVDFVYEPGQYAIRGGIVDVYSFANDNPYRLDFWGDEIDSIRTFEIETQLSQKEVKQVEIIASHEQEDDAQATLRDYLQDEEPWVIVSGERVLEEAKSFRTIELGRKSRHNNFAKIQWDTLPQPVFNKNFDLLIDDLQTKMKEGYQLYILSDQKKQTDRLAAIFEDLSEGTDIQIRFTPVDHTLHEGFIDRDIKIACYTDHEIFERFHRVSLRSENAKRGKAVVTLKEINQLQIGDYVVHSDHGIGTFGGLVTTQVNGKPQEMIKLIFRGGDTIFVSIHNLHRISKYKGKDGAEPTISKLGSGAWERLRERTKDKIKSIARDLIKLYATRKQQPGFAYSPDGHMQHELEASFVFEDTPDQAKATLDVKHDLESGTPMDRLICGDVGFGKTEVAMRAAFKVACDGKQVAVLVPTTVLALQHYQSFSERMKDFPVTIEYLSRSKTAKEQREILERLKDGKIDILIGTHKLVNKNVVWHDLGLLIIDEEQKFGVAVKEKLKGLRTNIDVLTLTATPIPRTLQFSLLGARDLSIIKTPPPNRYPIQTELITLDDEDIIQEAIEMEMNRNGQVFIVNNRIEMLERIERRIHRLCPMARTVVAHGQMPIGEMEQRLEEFVNYDYDVLISTTIVESGIDIPNVNTIIVYSAQHYGLSDLHQLRGRVGRSNRKAYCYLVTPERELLTADARRRLDALTTFSDLGAGFNLAMQDLDIRGAGNLLGAEQSGFIADLGYETYQRILNEAIEELKEEGDLSPSQGEGDQTANGQWSNEKTNWCSDCQMESDLALGFPSSYIENISERISLYRELDNIADEESLLAYKKRLIDRFGTMPEAAEELLNVVRLRWLCCRMGIEKIFLKGERLTLYFTTKHPSYWQSDMFQRFIVYATTRPERCLLKEERDKTGQPTGRRLMTVMQVKTIGGAINLLGKIKDSKQ